MNACGSSWLGEGEVISTKFPRHAEFEELNGVIGEKTVYHVKDLDEITS